MCPLNMHKINYIHRKQDTQLLLTNHATHFCECNGIDDPLKHASPRIGYHAKFDHSTSHGVAKIERSAPPLGTGA